MRASEVKASVNILDVVLMDASVELKVRGNKGQGRCPFHNDSHPSLTVYGDINAFKCYACGAKGDVIEYVRRRKFNGDVDGFKRALKYLSNEQLTSDFEEVARQRKEVVSRVDPIVMPVPSDAPEPTFEHYKFGMPKMVWDYKDEEGRLLGYVCRYEQGGRKEMRPYVCVETMYGLAWRHKGFPYKRPAYGLDKIGRHPDYPIVVVEGEKTADALQKVLNRANVIAWHGGAGNVHLTDWDFLRGRDFICWADNDWQGWCAMYHLCCLVNVKARFVGSPSGAPRGWDFADCDWDFSDTRYFIKDNLFDMRGCDARDGDKFIWEFDICGRRGRLTWDAKFGYGSMEEVV